MEAGCFLAQYAPPVRNLLELTYGDASVSVRMYLFSWQRRSLVPHSRIELCG
jgi:hypothetical protein